MNKFKKISKKIMSFVIVFVLTMGLFNGLTVVNTEAADYITVDEAKSDGTASGKFGITVIGEGVSSTCVFDVKLSGLTGPNQNRTSKNTKVSISKTDDPVLKLAFNPYNIALQSSQTSTTLSMSAGNNYSIVTCDLQFDMPAHTVYVGQETTLETTAKCNAYESITNRNATKGSNVTYTPFANSHSTSAYTKKFSVAINLVNCHMNNDEKYNVIIIHIRRNSYSISYDLGGGSFAHGYNTTFTRSDGLTQKQNPTTAKDGGESGYGNSSFYVEHPTKTGYTFKGWNITGMDSDTHTTWGSAGTYNFTSSTLNTTTNATLKNSTYIPYSFRNLRQTSGTVKFTALYDVNTYQVKFNGNGSTSGSMSNQTFTYDTAAALSSNTFVKTGYKFLGWATENGSATVVYTNRQSVKNLTATNGGIVNLYAVWQKNESNLTTANVLRNIEKIMMVNIVKVDETDDTITPAAGFNVYEWSQKLGAYKTESSYMIQANSTFNNIGDNYYFKYTTDNLGKFKIKEVYVRGANGISYINNGDEIELDESKCVDLPFYENTMVKKDRGVYVSGVGYAKGDIVRDTADKSGATYYEAIVANTGHYVTESAYWQRLTSSNYSNYSALVSGAGEWKADETYAQAFSYAFTNSRVPTRGAEFSLRKKDESGKLLSGAKFNIYYVNDGSLCRAMNEQANKKGNYASNYDENGNVRLIEPEIAIDDTQTHTTPAGTNRKTLPLLVKEVEAPEGYQKIKDFWVNVNCVYNTETGVWEVDSITGIFPKENGSATPNIISISNGGAFDCEELIDNSYKMKVKVVKQSAKGYYNISDLAGAEYTVYEDESLTLPVTTITIGTDGTGTSGELPMKDYWVKETKAPDSGKFHFSDAVQKVTAPATGSTELVQEVTATFIEDDDSGKLIVHKIKENGEELNGAEFTLYPLPSGVTEDNVDDYNYPDSSAVDTQKVTNGYAKFDDIPFGKYVLVETKVPEKHKKAANEIVEITEDNGGDSEATAVTITVVNYEEESRLNIYKVDSSDNQKLEGAVFKIYDVDNDMYLTSNTVTFDEEGNEVDSAEDSLFVTDEDGCITVEKLVNGTYRIEEVEAPEGYLLDSEPKTITIKEGNEDGKDGDGIPFYSVTFKDDKTETSFTKVDITTGEEITGGEYTVQDADGNIIDSWTGNGTAHKVYGLVPGQTYYFTEEAAPDGYTIAGEVEFTVNEDGTVTEVVMEDDYNKLEISKTDITSKEEIPGAHLELYNADGDLIDSWISETTPHRIDRIPVGTYTLVETQAPNGYVIAESITFEVGESNEVQTVEMEDDYTKTSFIKLASDTGEPLAGCVLQVLDKDRNVVDEWTTDGEAHEVYYLTAGETYYLHEVSAPDDYQLAEDIEFVAGEQWTDGNMIKDEDYNNQGGTSYLDEGGNLVYYDDNKIDTEEPENDITEDEDDEPLENVAEGEDGYIKEIELDDEDIVQDSGYDASAAEMVTITMLDKPKLVSILKKTELGDLLDGAEIELKDASGNIIESWTTNANVASVFRLGNGTYTIHEKSAPAGYELSEDITFEVTDDTTEVEYEMIDEYTGGSIKVIKLDEKTKTPLQGVEFTLKGENGLTYTKKTDENGEIVFGVVDGKSVLPAQTYTLTETSSFKGYSLLKDPVTITLPLSVTEAEAAADGLDKSKARWDSENEMYRFFDVTYEISDGTTLTLPRTGNSNLLYGIIAGAVVALLTGLFFWLKKRKKVTE